jgi:flagellar basal-body rod protein FlgB
MKSLTPDIFALAEQRLQWTQQRQAVLAQNIANANTPGFVAKDIEPFTAYLEHQQRPNGSGKTPKLNRVATLRSPDGNTVTMDEQLVQVAKTDMAHQLAMDLYKKYTSLYKAAIGRSS